MGLAPGKRKHRPGPERAGAILSVGLGGLRTRAEGTAIASKSKSRTRPRTSARPRPRPSAGPSVPLLPVLVGAALVVVAIALVIFALVNNNSGTKAVGSVQCNAGEQLQTHYHAHLTILASGTQATVPANIGITSTCLYWMHTHDDSGVIHIEAPADQKNRTFTLGDFFQVWGQPLSSHQVATIPVKSNQKLVAYVDGKAYDGDPNSIPLKSHTQVVLEITPPTVDPPPSYTFAPGL
jgi:hypothetical protein